MSENVLQAKSSNPRKTFRELLRLLADEYNSLSEADKKALKDKAELKRTTEVKAKEKADLKWKADLKALREEAGLDL